MRSAVAFSLLLLSVAPFGCAIDRMAGDDGSSNPLNGESNPLASLTEGFESGSKASYAAGSVTLASGSWTLDDALIGNLAGDVKNGSKAARVRNSGHVTMGFDHAMGASTVTVASATYGSDAAGSWGLFASQNGGGSWTQVGSPVTTTHTLTTTTFNVDLGGSIRFEIRKLDGGTNRIDIDDVAVTDSTGGGGGGGGDDDDDGGGGGGGGGSGGAQVSVHTTLGLPTPASTTDTTDYLSVKAQYVISYNGAHKTANWVSWEMNSSYTGGTSRQDDYRADNTLPSSVHQASLADYSSASQAYSRGHMCPSADRTASVPANQQTFYLTNMVPQVSNNNGGPWAKLENYERELADDGKEMFIVAGGIYAGTQKTIGSGVFVPSSTWKIIAVLDHTGMTAADITAATRVIAIVMPNDNSKIKVSDTWQQYRVSVRDIEAATGFDLMSDVDPAVQDVIETRVDNQ